MSVPEVTTAAPGRAWLLARLALSAAILIFLYTRLPADALANAVPEWTPTTMFWLAGALSFTLLAFILSAARWQQVLRALDLDAPIGRVFSIYMAGQFVSNILPSTVGGDVLRVSRLTKENGDRPTTFASVVLERLSGWIVLPVLTFIGLGVNAGLRTLDSATNLALATAVLTVVAFTGCLALVRRPLEPLHLEKHSNWRRFARAVRFNFARASGPPDRGLNVILVGACYSLCLVIAAWFAARSIGIDEVGPTALLAFYPAVLILQVLPVGISGLGVREGAFVVFLTPLGVPPEESIALGLLLFFITLTSSLVGAPAFAVGARNGQRDRRRIFS